MNKLLFYCGLGCALLVASIGCERAAKLPAPLPVDQMASEFNKAYAQAPREAKELVAVIEKTVRAKDYPSTFEALQTLAAVADLSNEQQALIGRGMRTISDLLETAQQQGDEAARTTLNRYRSTR